MLWLSYALMFPCFNDFPYLLSDICKTSALSYNSLYLLWKGWRWFLFLFVDSCKQMVPHLHHATKEGRKSYSVSLCILNLYISQNTFVFKTYLCNNVWSSTTLDWIAARVTCMRKTKADVLVSMCINMQCFLRML